MNRIRLHVVRTSLAFFRPCGPAMMAGVMRALSDRHPSTRALFPEETTQLHTRLFATLEQIVENMESFHRLERPLGELGRRVHGLGVRVEDYRHCREELLVAMASLAGEDWSEELESSWREVLEAVSGAMLAGTQGTRRAA